MDYDECIEGERGIRSKLLNDSTMIMKRKIYRVCERCGEVCLCHEQRCPNCNHNNIVEIAMNNLDNELENRIRCKYRYSHIDK